jgi:hypothetical protein
MKKLVCPKTLGAAPSLRRDVEKKHLRESTVAIEQRYGSQSGRSEKHGHP